MSGEVVCGGDGNEAGVNDAIRVTQEKAGQSGRHLRAGKARRRCLQCSHRGLWW